MTALSAAGLLSFANLGFDKGLLNALAAADGREDRAAAARLVATAFVLLGTVFGALLALFALLYPVTPWARLLNVGAAAADDAGPVMAARTLCALLASLVDTVQAARIAFSTVFGRAWASCWRWRRWRRRFSAARAIARGDIGWAERGLRRLILASLALAAAATVPLMLLGPALLRWWVGNALAAPEALFVALGLFWLLSALTQPPLAVFLSPANALRFYLVSVLLLAAGSVALKLLLSERLAMVGVAWGRVGAELLLLVPYALFLPVLIKRLRRRGAIA